MHTSTKYDLPAAYGVTFLTLLVRDPQCIFAFWEVSADDRRHAEQYARRQCSGDGQARLVLRMYDVTNGEKYLFDIDVTDEQSRYIFFDAPGRTYRASIGVQTEGTIDCFTVIAESNTVRTPPGRPSDIMEAEWMSFQQLFHPETVGKGASPVPKSLPLHFFWHYKSDAYSPGFTSMEGSD